MTTERLADDGAPGRAPDPSADAARPLNRPADNARQLSPGQLAAGRPFQPRAGAVDFLGLDHEVGAAESAAPSQHESWLMQVADEPAIDAVAPTEETREPELEIEPTEAPAVAAGESLPAPQLFNAAWNEKPQPKRRRYVLPVAAGATAAVLALAAIPWIRAGRDGEADLAERRREPVASREPAKPLVETARVEERAGGATLEDAAARGETGDVARAAVEQPEDAGGREPVAAAVEVEDPFAIVLPGAGRATGGSGGDSASEVAGATPPVASAEPEPALATPPIAAVASEPEPALAPAAEPSPAHAAATVSEPAAGSSVEPPIEPRRPRRDGSRRRAQVAAVFEPDTGAAASTAIAAPTEPAHGAVAAPLGTTVVGVAAPETALVAVGPPLALASDAPANAAASGRTSRLRIEDVLLLEGDTTTLRSATANDLKGVWTESSIPFEAIGAKSKLLTPQVGKVRVKTATADVFEGSLYAVGESQVWLDTEHGRIALPAAKVETIAQIDVPPATAAFAASAPKEERVRVRTPGGLIFGRVVMGDERKTTVVTDDGSRLTVDTALVERLTEPPRITLKRD